MTATTPCQAGSGNDDLDGAAGFDQLSGNSGNDVLRNGEVNDGGSGRNQIDPPPRRHDHPNVPLRP